MNVSKQMANISQERVRDRGVTWFPELKSMTMCEGAVVLNHTVGNSINTHLYWSMKNCKGKADQLKSFTDNIPSHYQAQFIYKEVCQVGDSIHLHYKVKYLVSFHNKQGR